MSKKTVYEDKADRQAARKRKREARLQAHIVKCPHCGADALDHMTKCPKCGGALTPSGYTPMSEEKRKKIRIVTYTLGILVAVAVVVIVLVVK